MPIDSVILKSYYPNLITLFELISPKLFKVDLIIKDDDKEYIDLLTTSLVNSDTTMDFPQITIAEQELNCLHEFISFDTVSIII
jgi:hypothetical protein